MSEKRREVTAGVVVAPGTHGAESPIPGTKLTLTCECPGCAVCQPGRAVPPDPWPIDKIVFRCRDCARQVSSLMPLGSVREINVNEGGLA